MIIDLHTHSTASDGALDPAGLLDHAIECGVGMLSITDHDTVAAYEQIIPTRAAIIRLVPGIEFSTNWRSTELHVLGLNIDPDDTRLKSGIRTQQQHRHDRARRMADKLAKVLRITDPLVEVMDQTGNSSIGRPHFAQHLVTLGLVKDTREAFNKYLAAGKRCYVRQQWAGLEDIITWIRNAGGTAVLAHPGTYKLTRTRLHALLDDFIAAGGEGLEVVSGRQSSSLTDELARLCCAKGLLASCGSDFHHSGQDDACKPGRFAHLPESCVPVWDKW